MSNLHRFLANAQLCPRVPLSVLYLKNMPLSKPSIPCVILKTSIWSPRIRLCFYVLRGVRWNDTDWYGFSLKKYGYPPQNCGMYDSLYHMSEERMPARNRLNMRHRTVLLFRILF